MEAREALELLKLSHDIVSGNALEEAEFYRYAELVARTTNKQQRWGSLLEVPYLQPVNYSCCRLFDLGEAASVIVSGVDVVLDVSSTASNIYMVKMAE